MPPTIPPNKMGKYIEEGRTKYTYGPTAAPDDVMMANIQKGKFGTDRYPVQEIDHAQFKKIRSGREREQEESKQKKQHKNRK